MSFAYPFVLWLLPPLAVYLYRRPPRRVTTAADIFAVLFVIMALASPYANKSEEPITYQSREIILALDVSHSMRARDIAPDRYTYAKRLIKAFLVQNRTDAVGLIAFTTNPLFLAPPTTDHALVATALDALRIDAVLTKGTSLKNLFSMLTKLEGGERTVVLLTDGGEERDAQTLAALLPPRTRLVIVALATQAGAEVPDVNLHGTQRTPPLIVSRRNPMLKTLAELTDATLLVPDASPERFARTLKKALTQSRLRLHDEKRRQKVSLAWLFLLPALILFWVAHTKAVRYLVWLAALAHLPLQAGVTDQWHLMQAYRNYQAGDYNVSLRALQRIDAPSLQSRYLHASLLYRLGRYKQAAQMFSAIRTTNPNYKQALLYNAATAYAQAGDYKKATRYFVHALQLGHDDDARANLARVLCLRTQSVTQGYGKPSASAANPNTSQELQSADANTSQSQSSSANSGGGNAHAKPSVSQARPHTLRDTSPPTKLPLSSKVYDVINKGYIRETKPW